MNLLDMIPDHVAKGIAQSNCWTDEDVWPLGNGFIATFNVKTSTYTISNAKTKQGLGSISLQLVCEKGRKVP